MRSLLLTVAIALSGAGIAQGRCPLDFPGSEQAAIGIYVAEVNGGRVVEDFNADMLLTPASVMKSVSTAAVIIDKGGDFRWITKVYAVGQISGGVLHGNIVVQGSGDPTLGSTQFSDSHPDFVSAVKSAVAAKGISRVDGKIVQGDVWPQLGPVPSWEIEDIPGVDGAGFYTLNYKDNIFTLSVPSMTATPAIPGLQVKQMGGSGGLWFTRFPGSNELRVYGRLGKRQKRAALKCSMPNPPAVLLSELSRELNASGNVYDTSADTVEILAFRSPALREVARSLMVRSDNQMAEAALRALAPRRGRAIALKAERDILSSHGVNLDGARLADGSGLSRHNAISARQLGSVLRAMATNGDYIGSYARVGLDGTVRNFMKSQPGRENFILKSGSMTGVICYVGYRLDAETKAPTHVIVVMINNAPEPSKVRAALGEFISKIGS